MGTGGVFGSASFMIANNCNNNAFLVWHAVIKGVIPVILFTWRGKQKFYIVLAVVSIIHRKRKNMPPLYATLTLLFYCEITFHELSERGDIAKNA